MNAVTDREEKVKKRLDDITRGDAYKRSLNLGGMVADTLKKQVENVKKSIERQDFKKAEKELDDLKKLAENPTEAL
jgi:DNA primase large subunit